SLGSEAAESVLAYTELRQSESTAESELPRAVPACVRPELLPGSAHRSPVYRQMVHLRPPDLEDGHGEQRGGRQFVAPRIAQPELAESRSRRFVHLQHPSQFAQRNTLRILFQREQYLCSSEGQGCRPGSRAARFGGQSSGPQRVPANYIYRTRR